jgi:tRNA 5-methylaminomethyl-2-thiouridine biosynthesis bifunctional protein
MKIIVVGAGLAGAACAYALAQRGCDVTVLDAGLPGDLAPTPTPTHSTAPSSGLPVGLMAPHVSASNSTASQLSHLGIAATLQAARALLVDGRDWQQCGALQRAGKLGPQAHWFEHAAWVKPAALVAAWLAHPRITLRHSTEVHQVRGMPSTVGRWQALNAQGHLLAEANAAVLANANQASTLLARLTHADGAPQPINLALHQVAGQVVYGPWTPEWQTLWPTLLPELAQHRSRSASAIAAGIAPTAQAHSLAACAVNGHGHFIPAVPWGSTHLPAAYHGQLWLSGSTYEHGVGAPTVTSQGIASNVLRLQQLLPAAAQLLAQQHSAGQLHGWAGLRCTTRDRLPMVGALPTSQGAGLYVCTGIGSRGLSYAAVCGEHIAALINQGRSTALPLALQQAMQPLR